MPSILLITVLGQDRPGLTASLNTLLSDLNLLVLDIGQATIHDDLCMGLMVRFQDNTGKTLINQVTDQVKIWGEQHELKVRVHPVSATKYKGWVQRQGRPRHVITLLARRISPEQVAAISQVCARRALSIDNITRLSGRIPLDDAPKPIYACVEFSVRGRTNRDELRTELLQVALDNDMDVSVQEDDLYRRNRRLVVLDMDSTLITSEVIDELAVHANVRQQVANITELAMQGKMDFRKSLQERVKLLRGTPADCFEKVAAALHPNEGAERLINTLNHLGLHSAIVSGGFGYFARHLQQRLGIQHAFANELEIRDNILTGRIKGEIIDARGKVRCMRRLCEQNGWSLKQAIAVGDGANDIPMLSSAGLGIAFRAKPKVRESSSHSLTHLGLDAILYLLGLRDQDYPLRHI